MMLGESTGEIILSVVVVIGFLMISGLIITGFLLGGSKADTMASQESLVSAINLMNDKTSRALKISMDRGSFITGFSANQNTELKRAKWFHIFHASRIIDHPNSGVCSLNSACICAGSTNNFNPKKCLALNPSITNIYFVGRDWGINLGSPVDNQKNYLALATTSLHSYHILLNISRKGSSIIISISQIKKT